MKTIPAWYKSEIDIPVGLKMASPVAFSEDVDGVSVLVTATPTNTFIASAQHGSAIVIGKAQPSLHSAMQSCLAEAVKKLAGREGGAV